jgi:hypothetical protein
MLQQEVLPLLLSLLNRLYSRLLSVSPLELQHLLLHLKVGRHLLSKLLVSASMRRTCASGSTEELLRVVEI